jgi:hypothetical protein
MGIRLGDVFTRIFIEESLELGVERIEMFLCPLDPELRTEKRINNPSHHDLLICPRAGASAWPPSGVVY